MKTKKCLILSLLAAVIVLLMVSCPDTDKSVTTLKPPPITIPNSATVYTAGFFDGGNEKACYWKDKLKTNLPVGTGISYAKAITQSGGSIYIAGYYSDGGNSIACYWKDGIKTDLPAGAGASHAYAITQSGGSIYIAGCYDDGGTSIACYWKDGIKTDLPGINSLVNGITVVAN